MFDFFKENIVYISVPFFVLEIASCLFYGMEFAHLLVYKSQNSNCFIVYFAE